MSPYESALLIQRYAAEAIEGLRTQGATADTESRLVDITALARAIATVLQPAEPLPEKPAGLPAESKPGAESSEPTES